MTDRSESFFEFKQVPTQSKVYPGTLQEFRMGMERLSELHYGSYTSRCGNLFHFREEQEVEPERATWVVTPSETYTRYEQGERYSTIQVYQEAGGKTCRVEFLDNQQSFHPMLEDSIHGFDEFCEWVIREVWPAQVSEPTPALERLQETLTKYGPEIGKGEETEPLPEQDPLAAARSEVKRFKSHVERQAYRDIYTDGKPQENIARALLQAFLPERSYREVQVRGGQSDLLLFVKQGRFLYETKIWRGPEYYKQGLKEIEEYIIGEDDDQELMGIFYIVFDHTETKRARAYQGGDFSTEVVGGRSVDVVVVDLSPPEPSKKD